MKLDLQKIRKMQLKMELLATDLLAGMYRSAFKGKGMEFQEVREFQAGDDVRAIDWNVTARMGTPYIKLYKEERELTVILMVDISASTRFGSNVLKSTILNEIAAVLAFSGIKNQDRIGLLLYSDIIEHYVPPQKGSSHVLRLIRDLIAFKAESRGTSIGKALHFLGQVQKKRSLVFLLSDFIDAEDNQKEIAVSAKKHDLIAISIHDPLEKSFPNVGLLKLKELETGQVTLLDTSSTQLQAQMSSYFDTHLAKTKKLFKQSGADWIEIATDVSYVQALRKFFLEKQSMR